MIVLIVIALVLAALIVWFKIPFSPLKREFSKDVKALTQKTEGTDPKLIQKSDFAAFPKAIQKYVENCGYIGTPHKDYLCMFYKNVDFMQGINGPKLKIDYTQYDFVAEPCRLALIDSSMFGIPFQGYDYYQNGKGGMKGVIAKGITLFNQTGDEMDKSCLVTYLAECLFVPSALLQGFITFEEIDDHHVRATIKNGDQAATGVFTFNQQYEYVSFTTNDRSVTNSDGTMENIPWSAICGNYQTSESGIKYPSILKAVWNYPDNDLGFYTNPKNGDVKALNEVCLDSTYFVYFDGKISEVK